jgi:hypothetical protein
MNQSLSGRLIFPGPSEKESKKICLTHFYPAHPEASVEDLCITSRKSLISLEKTCQFALVTSGIDSGFPVLPQALPAKEKGCPNGTNMLAADIAGQTKKAGSKAGLSISNGCRQIRR